MNRIIFCLIFLLNSRMIKSQDFISGDVISNVYNITYGNKSGTSFLIERDSVNYFITAKHIFHNVHYNDKISVKILQDGKWLNLYVIAYFDTIKKTDIIVLKPLDLAFISTGITLKEIGLFLGDEGYFLGFPFGLSNEDNGNINNGFPIPLFKKAVFSGSQLKNGIFKLYLDGHNNPGFSGGPVLFKNRLDPKSSKFCLVGVISGYYPQTNELVISNEVVRYTENSGIVIAYSSNHITEIIKKIVSP